MVITMPVQYGHEAFLEFQCQSEHYWHDVQLEMQTKYQNVLFTMPEFKIAASHELSSRISEPETRSIFGQTADFSGISDEEGLRVTRILQSTYIVVDQHGTEAAAGTLAEMLGAGAPPEEEVTLTIDHPFMFAIVDKPTGVVLFAGKAVNPTESGQTLSKVDS